MFLRFKFTNDCSEPADCCIRCRKYTQERSVLRLPGIRLSVYTCRTCLAEIAMFFWFFHEWPLRASMLARERKEAGETEVCYENSYGWSNGSSPPANKNPRQRRTS